VGVCFVPLDPGAPKFFGFSEFLTGLALMVLAWTIADVRYRFRVRTAPVPLFGGTYVVVSAIGVLTLVTDLWRAQGWLVPKGNLLTPATWQAILAALFLLTFLTWAFFALIRPPKFGKWNAKQYARTLYGMIVKGSPDELAVVAGELMYSANSLVRHAAERHNPTEFGELPEEREKLTEAADYANSILLLIADKRFCRAIVESSPGTAWVLFQEIGGTKKYSIRIQTFAKNLANEALANKDSFIYRETAGGYESGLLGFHQPLCQAMFSSYEMVEEIGTMLDPSFPASLNWDAEQWEAYSRIILLTLRDYVEKGIRGHSYVLYRAFDNIKGAAFDLYKLNGVSNSAWNDDIQRRLRAIVKFIQGAVEILEGKGVPDNLRLRISSKDPHRIKTTFDHVANLIFEVIFAASAVNSPRDVCWWIQYNSVWGELFNFEHLAGPAGTVVKFKVCRLLYHEVVKMKSFPNFKGAKILAFCLNIMGIERRKGNYDRDSRALHRAVLTWTKKNYAWLYNENPNVAVACLVDGMSWDAENCRIVLTYPPGGLSRTASFVCLDVDPLPPRAAGTEQESAITVPNEAAVP
jgi:hypothetical protein